MQKKRSPAPVITTTRTAASFRASLSAWVISSTVWRRNVLPLSGRLIVIHATWFLISKRMSAYAMMRLLRQGS